jgi:hypothetical protein
MTKLILAIAIIESSLNPSAVGDGGKAVGIMQIHPCVITDVNYFCKSNYKNSDRRDTEKSFEICQKYLTYWGSVYEERTALKCTAEVYAKIWNGGPFGWKKEGAVKERLDRYWFKVQQELNRLQK